MFPERELGYVRVRGRRGGDSGEKTVEALLASILAYWWREGVKLNQPLQTWDSGISDQPRW
jgi:hypothetical protein